jgi:hypothetical protein
MRTALRLGILTLSMVAAAATLAQQPDSRIKRGRDLGELPPLRRELPELDQRSPGGGVARQRPPVAPPEEPPPRQPRPPIDQAEGGRDPIVTVADRGPRNSDSVGTAFAIDASGDWVTAGHVVDGCKMVYIFVKGDWLPVTVLGTHNVADVAVARTREGGPPLQVASAEPLKVDQDGFQFGFPQFKPGETHVRLLGRVRVSRSERGGPMEVAYQWAEVSRRPNFEGTLGGISGGPIVDSRGVVVGVNILESSRRGRVTTSAPESVLAVLKQARVTPASDRVVDITPENFDMRADEVRESYSVARVFCAYNRDSQPPRPRRN